jgi:predicted Zn-dependent peptidase
MTPLNRKEQPPRFTVSPGIIPEAEKAVLKNGVIVYLIDAGTEELMKLDFIFEAGQIEEETPMLSSAVNSMLAEGTERFTAEDLNKNLDFFGAIFNNFTEKDAAGISVLFLNKHIEKILELSKEILFHPVFPEAELISLMNKRLQWYHINQEKVQNIAFERFFESIFGSVHPYGRRVIASDFEGLSVQMLRDFHTLHYDPSGMTIIVSGKIHPGTTALLDEYFGNLPVKKKNQKEHLSPSSGSKGMITISKKGAVQSSIRIGSVTIGKRQSDYHGLKILDTILGGYFGSRLMKNIREEKGFTYGITSGVTSYNLAAYKIICTEVGSDYTQKTIDEIYKEIKLLQEVPAGKDEMDIVRNFMLGEMVRMFDGPFTLSESFRSVWEFGLDNSYYYDLARKIKTIEPDEIMNLAKTYYKIDDLHVIVVGPE